MGDIVSLKLHRKRKAREERDAAAEQNRVSFGRGKAEKTLTDALNEKARRELDAQKRED